MAQRFNSVPTFAYIGAPQGAATVLCTSPSAAPNTVPLTIDWAVYWAEALQASTVAVSVDLGQISPAGGALNEIRSLKIDNTFSTSPIYVEFGDTGDVVTCPPQSVVTMPVNTNQQKFKIIAQNLVAGFLPFTRLYLYNFQMPPSFDPAIQYTYPQFLGSPLIQRSLSEILTPGFGPPALGDQIKSIKMTPTAGVSQTILPAVAAGGFYTITAVHAYQTTLTGSGPVLISATVDRNPDADVIFDWVFSSNANLTTTLVQLSGMNLKFEADNEIRIFTPVPANTSAFVRIIVAMAYTYNLTQ